MTPTEWAEAIRAVAADIDANREDSAIYRDEALFDCVLALEALADWLTNPNAIDDAALRFSALGASLDADWRVFGTPDEYVLEDLDDELDDRLREGEQP